MLGESRLGTGGGKHDERTTGTASEMCISDRLNVMLSEQAQNRIVSEGQDILSYSQNVPLRLTEYLKEVRSVVEENHMYIRIASNDFFAVSKDVVSKMLSLIHI